MAISEKLLAELNTQIKHEFASDYYYLSMSAYFDSLGLDGAANFFRLQAEEERSHALRIYDYLLERGEQVTLQALEAPKVEFDSPIEALRLALEHERFITKRIYHLVELAREQGEYATESMLQWFVDEQVEEEATMESILDHLELVGEQGEGLYLIDAELGKRTVADHG